MAAPILTSVRSLRITVGPHRFVARLEEERAPRTCEFVRSMLPFRSQLIHARWSGEACWVPMGERREDLPVESATSHPAPGELLLYPGGLSEMEILFPYGAALFASKVGQLAGNHFATVTEGGEQLAEMGRLVLWKGAQSLQLEEG